MAFKCVLFVPGARPDRFRKAAESGADAVCIDLEDAVAQSEKASARAATLQYLESMPSGGAAIGLRVNGLKTTGGTSDVLALSGSGARPAFIVIPKASSADDVHQLRAALGAECPPIWPMLEDPGALGALTELARAAGAEGALMLGGVDYSAALGVEPNWDALYHARASLVAAAAAAGCHRIDAPYINIKDEAGLAAETARVKAMGFTGRASIHPAQVASIQKIFTPSADEISKAEKIAAIYDSAGGGVALHEGGLVEKPVRERAQRVLDAGKPK